MQLSNSKRLVVIAGEESGDKHAAVFIQQLRQRIPNLEVSGIGGKHMQDAGAQLVSDLASYGVTGTTEIIRHFRILRRAYRNIQIHLASHKPDLLVLVDFPGFNIRLAKFAKQKLGLRIIYYISPQIWAWKASRIHTLRQNVDHMAVILPFEKNIYANAGVRVSFVGHPLTDTVKDCLDIKRARKELNIPQEKRILALLPGSRKHEIELHLPTFIECAQNLLKQIPHLHLVVPIARTLNPDLVTHYFKNLSLPVTFIIDQAIKTVSCSDYVIVASGTASLECALLKKPMCIVYKTSLITYLAASQLIKVKYIGLCNLLQNAMIVPELLQYDFNSAELTRTMLDLMTDQPAAERMTKRLEQLQHSLSQQQSDCTISELIENEL